MRVVRHLLEALVCALACYAVGVYAWLGAQRCVYPVEVDFIEGVMLDHVARFSAGQPIYVEPSLHFIPLAYMPLFSVASGLVAHFTGVSFFAMRVVSLVSSLLLVGLLAWIVWRETRRLAFAAAAGGIYALAFSLTGACHDVGRPDSMMLLLTFSGLALLRWTRGAAGALGAAALLTLGFFTKQHSLLFSAGALAFLFVHDRRRFPVFAAAIVAGCLGGYLLLTAWLGEWFRVFTWSIPRGWSEISVARIERYLGAGLFGALACSSVPALLSLAAPDAGTDRRRMLWYWAGLAGVGTGLLATLDKNAYLHVFTPTVVALAVLGPLALDRILRHLESAAPASRTAAIAALAVLAGQFVPLVYSPRPHLPRPHAAEAHDALIARIRDLPEGALVPYHSWYEREAGGKGSLQFIALDDIERSRGNVILERDPAFLEKMFAPLRSGPGRPAIVTDVTLEHSGPLWRGIAPGYALAESLGKISAPLVPLTGNRHSVTYIYLPVDSGPVAAAP